MTEPNFYPSAPGEKRPYLQNLKNWHLMIIDFMLINPSATQQEIADHFGYNRETVSLVINSDVFQMKLEERREQFAQQVNGTAIQRLEGKVAALAEDAVDTLREKIQLERQQLGLEQTRETAEMALNALGYGTKGRLGASQQTTTVNVLISKEDLAKAREKLINPAPPVQAALPRPPETLEGE